MATRRPLTMVSGRKAEMPSGDLLPSEILGTALAAIYGLTPAADRLPYFDSTSTAALATFTAGGRALVNSAGTANTFPYFSASNTVTLGAITSAARSLLADATVPRLSTANTWTAENSFNGNTTLGDANTDTTTVRGKAIIGQASDHWATSSSHYIINTEASPYGQIDSHGSFRVSLTSNGYRKGSSLWQSYGVNGYTGASQIELDPQGVIYFRAESSKATDSASTITQVGQWNATALTVSNNLVVNGNTTLGDASGDTLTINANTAAIPNGLNFGSDQVVIGTGGNIAFGGAVSTSAGVYMRKAITGATSSYGLLQSVTINSGVTTAARGFSSVLATQAAAFTCANVRHFDAAQGSIGAGSAITTQIGFFADSSITGATTNYGFYGDIAASGTARYNFYAASTAPNYFAGATTCGNQLTANGSSSGIGYSTGAGGTVTQATNKSTGVTLNRPTGRITLNNAALAADTTVSFTLTNSTIAANDHLVLNHTGTGTGGAYSLNAQCAAGSAVINVRNVTAGSLSEAIVIGYAVIKGVTS